MPLGRGHGGSASANFFQRHGVMRHCPKALEQVLFGQVSSILWELSLQLAFGRTGLQSALSRQLLAVVQGSWAGPQSREEINPVSSLCELH